MESAFAQIGIWLAVCYTTELLWKFVVRKILVRTSLYKRWSTWHGCYVLSEFRKIDRFHFKATVYMVGRKTILYTEGDAIQAKYTTRAFIVKEAPKYGRIMNGGRHV